MFSDEFLEAQRNLEQVCYRFRKAFDQRSERPWSEFREACVAVSKAVSNLEKARRA